MINAKSLLIIFLFLTVNLYSQADQSFDKVYKIDNTMIEGKILRITESLVEINPKGDISFISIPKNEITVIIYADNSVLNFNSSKAAKKDLTKDVKTDIVVAKKVAEKVVSEIEIATETVQAEEVSIEKEIAIEAVPIAETHKAVKQWQTNYKTFREIKSKLFNYHYVFQNNPENGTYHIYDSINNQMIGIKESGTFTSVKTSNVYSKKNSLSISEIALDLEFQIGNEVVKSRLTSADLGWKKKNGFEIEAPFRRTKRGVLAQSKKSVEMKDYIITYYLEIMIPDRVYIYYSIQTKD